MSKNLLSQIEDIYEVGKVSYFSPLFFITLSSTVILLGLIYVILKRKKQFKNSWRYVAYIEIKTLEAKAEINNKEIFPLVKKIAIRKFAREDIANLHGKNLLNWLSQNLSKKVNWQNYGPHIDRLYDKEPLVLNKDEALKILKEVRGWL